MLCFFIIIILKLTGNDLIFKDFFKVQVNINLGSNIFDFSIWALFITIETKNTLKIQKINECKKCNSNNKSEKKKKKKQKKSQILKKVVNGQLPISLTVNRCG
jgi:hypothetical protein